MKIIIVPLAGRLVVEVGIEPTSLLIRRIDRSLYGEEALQETTIPGTSGWEEFVALLQADPSGATFTDSLAWLIAQQS